MFAFRRPPNPTPHPQTCERCPHRYSERGCPAWVTAENGFLETNVTTGEERIVTGCFYQVIPKLLAHVVRAVNRPAASMDKMATAIAVVGSMVARVDRETFLAAVQDEHDRNPAFLGRGEPHTMIAGGERTPPRGDDVSEPAKEALSSEASAKEGE